MHLLLEHSRSLRRRTRGARKLVVPLANTGHCAGSLLLSPLVSERIQPTLRLLQHLVQHLPELLLVLRLLHFAVRLKFTHATTSNLVEKGSLLRLLLASHVELLQHLQHHVRTLLSTSLPLSLLLESLLLLQPALPAHEVAVGAEQLLLQ